MFFWKQSKQATNILRKARLDFDVTEHSLLSDTLSDKNAAGKVALNFVRRIFFLIRYPALIWGRCNCSRKLETFRNNSRHQNFGFETVLQKERKLIKTVKTSSNYPVNFLSSSKLADIVSYVKQQIAKSINKYTFRSVPVHLSNAVNCRLDKEAEHKCSDFRLNISTHRLTQTGSNLLISRTTLSREAVGKKTLISPKIGRGKDEFSAFQWLSKGGKSAVRLNWGVRNTP